MIPQELIKKIRQIQIYTSRTVDASFAGQYESVFKGRGMQFDEVREFGTGSDETRSVAVADLDGDGVLDIVAATIGEPNAVYLGLGGGRFGDGIGFGADQDEAHVGLHRLDRHLRFGWFWGGQNLSGDICQGDGARDSRRRDADDWQYLKPHFNPGGD